MKDQEFQKVTDSIRKKMTKWGDKIVVGQYTGENVKREEGERWVDHDGKEWEMKGGIARSISKLQGAKTPWWCPVCEKTMTKLDTAAFRVHAMCLDCVAREETRQKLDGTWERTREMGILRNQIAYLKDKLIEITYYYDTVDNIELQHYDDKTGNLLMIDKYTVPVDKLKADLKKEAVEINKNLKEREERLAELESEVEKENESTETD